MVTADRVAAPQCPRSEELCAGFNCVHCEARRKGHQRLRLFALFFNVTAAVAAADLDLARLIARARNQQPVRSTKRITTSPCNRRPG